MQINKYCIAYLFFVGKRKQIDATETADANRSTNGIGYSPTTQTTIVKVYLWIGSCFPRVVFADVIR